MGEVVPGRPARTPKVFVVGLPRTGTTSICVALLELGFKVAHTAYEPAVFDAADAVADTPVFSRYRQLDEEFPGARFICLERNLDAWLPSVQRLLASMHRHLHPVDGGLDEQVKACYRDVFGALSPDRIRDREYLGGCYVRHRARGCSITSRPALRTCCAWTSRARTPVARSAAFLGWAATACALRG